MGVAGISEGDEPSTHVGVTMVARATNAVVATEAGRLLLFPPLRLLSRTFAIVLQKVAEGRPFRSSTPF